MACCHSQYETTNENRSCTESGSHFVRLFAIANISPWTCRVRTRISNLTRHPAHQSATWIADWEPGASSVRIRVRHFVHARYLHPANRRTNRARRPAPPFSFFVYYGEW